MLFNSWHFALFFPTVALLYFALPQKWRWLLLLVASYFFYMCSVPAYGLLLAFSTVLDWSLGLAIGGTKSPRAKRILLVVSLATNLGLLFSFKYFNFVAQSIGVVTESLGIAFDLPYSNWILPVGISFYTFQSLSYTIDVFRGEQPPERHLGKFALFVSFFPQLVAGPIERSTALLPQFDEHHKFDYDRVVSGLRLMAWGLFKKIVIADQLAILVNGVYNEPSGLVGPHFVLATVFFAFQIYCDFSGYSDVAIGAAQVLGFRLMMNFNRPYIAQSVAEFWSRWHISLSTWFRDYLYIPLGGNRVALPRWYLNLLIVFLVSGVWHGAKWTFVVWGALHGLYLVVSLISKPLRERAALACGLKRVPLLHAAARTTIVFALVCFAWIFFRADSLSDAMFIVGQLSVGWENLAHAGWLREARIDLGVSDRYLALSIGLIVLLNAAEYFQDNKHFGELLGRRAWPVRWVVYASLLLAIINLGAPKAEPFIYFQF